VRRARWGCCWNLFVASAQNPARSPNATPFLGNQFNRSYTPAKHFAFSKPKARKPICLQYFKKFSYIWILFYIPPTSLSIFYMQIDQSLVQNIEISLQTLSKFYPIRQILSQEVDKKFIKTYHTQSRWGYKYLHSRAGAIHLAINYEGYFTPQGFYEHTKIINQILEKLPDATAILELGSGNGFNTVELANKNSQRHFTGLDLTATSLREARSKAKKLKNVQFVEGDFHKLPFGDQSFDVVFAIEALCHSNQPEKVLQEAYRILKPQGLLINIDGFRYPTFEKLPKVVQEAAQLVEITTAVQQGVDIDKWIAMGQVIGFAALEKHDFSENVLPNLQRFYNMATQFLYPAWRRRLLTLLLPKPLLTNVVAGMLIRDTVKAQAQGYFEVVLQKNS
jgi:ubiquinone/menaquinone biosynthesis C-methylase UbiE